MFNLFINQTNFLALSSRAVANVAIFMFIMLILAIDCKNGCKFLPKDANMKKTIMLITTITLIVFVVMFVGKYILEIA